MAQKIVIFEVAKALKEAGYPQDERNITEIGWYNKAGVFTRELPFFWEGDDVFVALAPSYIDAWLWLWREKGIQITPKKWLQPSCLGSIMESDNGLYHEIYDLDKKDPEEAIAKAIDYLVENKLLK